MKVKIYKFKCKDCGSKKYEKLDENTYKCLYCGSTEEVHFNDENKEKEQSDEISSERNERFEYDEGTTVLTTRGARKIDMHSLVILLCAIFGGYFGLHRFVEGKILSGLLYVFTGGLFGIGYTIDIVLNIVKFLKTMKRVD